MIAAIYAHVTPTKQAAWDLWAQVHEQPRSVD